MQNKKKVIYIIEDDISINHGIELTLGTEFEYQHYYSLKEIEKIELADLIILDINLPDGNGFEYLKKLRETYETPVLILTANDTEVDEVTGLSLGANDYVTKPFSILELLARAKAFLRRGPRTGGTVVPQAEPSSQDIIEFNGIRINFKRFEATKNDMPFEMSAREFQILQYFWSKRGEVVWREDLLQDIWGYTPENMPSTRTIDNHIVNLRKKIETDPTNPKIILSIRGAGYKLDV